jgi:hypothetical protein
MTEDCHPVALDMFVPADVRSCFGQRDRRVALRKSSGSRRKSSIQLDGVEGVQEDACVMPPVTNAIEARHAALATGDSLPIDAGTRAPSGKRSVRSLPGRL